MITELTVLGLGWQGARGRSRGHGDMLGAGHIGSVCKNALSSGTCVHAVYQCVFSMCVMLQLQGCKLLFGLRREPPGRQHHRSSKTTICQLAKNPQILNLYAHA